MKYCRFCALVVRIDHTIKVKPFIMIHNTILHKRPDCIGRFEDVTKFPGQQSEAISYHFSSLLNSAKSLASNVHNTLSHDGMSFNAGRIGGFNRSFCLRSMPDSGLLFGALNRFLASFLNCIFLIASSYSFTSISYLHSIVKSVISSAAIVQAKLVTFSTLIDALE